MKVVILAGGKGTRLSEYTSDLPKPLVSVNNLPIIHHIMNIYSSYGFKEFVIALGYKGSLIADYFRSLAFSSPAFTLDLSTANIHHHSSKLDWKVTLVDTGLETMTGGRIKKLSPYIGDNDFLLTYGDGLSDVHIPSVIQSHNLSDSFLTLTAVKPPARFGELNIQDGKVLEFEEKPQLQHGYINGGFFVASPKILEYIHDDMEMLEREPMTRLIHDSKVSAYKHDGFWQCMDTRRDKENLENLCNRGTPPWVN